VCCFLAGFASGFAPLAPLGIARSGGAAAGGQRCLPAPAGPWLAGREIQFQRHDHDISNSLAELASNLPERHPVVSVRAAQQAHHPHQRVARVCVPLGAYSAHSALNHLRSARSRAQGFSDIEPFVCAVHGTGQRVRQAAAVRGGVHRAQVGKQGWLAADGRACWDAAGASRSKTAILDAKVPQPQGVEETKPTPKCGALHVARGDTRHVQVTTRQDIPEGKASPAFEATNPSPKSSLSSSRISSSPY
jgi:hypothetical protein